MSVSHMECVFNTKCLDDKLITVDESECKCCLNMKRVVEEMQEELSSARLIIRLLQADGNITGIDTAVNQETNHDSRNNKFKDWKLVSDSKVRANRTTPVQQPQPHPIPTIINRYAVLDNHNNSQVQQREYINTLLFPKEGSDGVTDSARASQQTKRK